MPPHCAQREKTLEEAAEKASLVADLEAEKEIQSGGELRERQLQVDALSLALAQTATDAKNKADSLAAEEKALQVRASVCMCWGGGAGSRDWTCSVRGALLPVFGRAPRCWDYQLPPPGMCWRLIHMHALNQCTLH
eukprot:354109-Chlamydomonas_euryale.AAC.4